MIIQPIDEVCREQVRIATRDYISLASDIHRIRIKPIQINFDLTGRAAGMYRVQSGQRCIRYNPYLFAKYFSNNLTTTVPHEVAHYVTDLLYGLRKVKPHGIEWREIMLSLGAKPRVTGNYDLDGIPVRRHKHFAYRCDCSTHKLGAVRHKRILQGKAAYYCRQCSTAIQPDINTTACTDYD